MRIFRIFWHEYKTHLTRRSYLMFTFGFPLFMAGAPLLGVALMALAIRAMLPATDPRPVGLIDGAGLFAATAVYPEDPVPVLAFPSAGAAAAALDAGHIQAYYEVHPDYWATGRVTLSYDVAPSLEIRNAFDRWLQDQVRARIPADILARLDKGPRIVHRDTAGTRVYAGNDILRAILVFALLYFVRMGGSFTAEYMFGSIVSEADNRTLEIILSTVSPLQFVVGKLLGLLAVGLTQLGTWAGAALVAALALSTFFKADLVGPLLAWPHWGVMISVLLGSYMLDQMLAATLGLLRVSGGAGGLLFGMMNSVVGIALLYAAYFVPRNPHTPLAVGASLLPITAPLVLLIRLVVSEVPTWQIFLSQALLWGTNLVSILWLRRLLQANLVSYAPSFSLRRWFRQAVLVLRRSG